MPGSAFPIEEYLGSLDSTGVLASLRSLKPRVAALSLLSISMAAAVLPSPLRAAQESVATALESSPEFRLLTEGWALTPQDVAVLERRVTENSDGSDARKLLISYYFQHAQREPRLRHIHWMIENDPGSDIFDFRGALVPVHESPLGGLEAFQRVRELWLEQVRKHPQRPRVFANAARMLWQGDPERAAEFWRRALSLEPNKRQWTFRLARLHAVVLQTDGRMNPRTAWSAERKALADRFLAELRTSNDALLVGQVGEILTPPVDLPPELRKIRGMQVWPPRVFGMTELAEELLQRARKLQPNEPRWERSLERLGQARREMAAVDDGDGESVGPEPGRAVPDRIDKPRLLKRVAPKYPPLASQARLQGSVWLTLSIGRDGRVEGSQVVSGHPLLIGAARDAVSQWRFEPVFDDSGQRIETTTDVRVSFHLLDPAQP